MPLFERSSVVSDDAPRPAARRESASCHRTMPSSAWPIRRRGAKAVGSKPRRCAPRRCETQRFQWRQFKPRRCAPRQFEPRRFKPRRFKPRQFTQRRFESRRFKPRLESRRRAERTEPRHGALAAAEEEAEVAGGDRVAAIDRREVEVFERRKRRCEWGCGSHKLSG
eukprot:4935284-Prymnesium_polylepis.1